MDTDTPAWAPAPTGAAKAPGKRFWSRGRKRAAAVAAVLALLAGGLALWFFNWGPAAVPAIVLERPAPVAAASREDIVVDVRLTDLPAGVYPGASLAVAFDPARLQFVEVRQGTMATLAGQGKANIPIWAADPAYANREGQVKAMYLDQTGGDFAYTDQGFAKGTGDCVLRLVFRLRDAAWTGDRLELAVTDAVFATTDNELRHSSLATAARTLRAFATAVEVI